jgi:NitT/TauT family transport system substrate-binding protein
VRAIRVYNDALKDGHFAGPRADDVIAVLTKATPIKDAALYRRIVPSAVNPDGGVNMKGLRGDLAFFRELGLIENKDITVDQVVDNSFAQAAVEKLGPYRPAASN